MQEQLLQKREAQQERQKAGVAGSVPLPLEDRDEDFVNDEVDFDSFEINEKPDDRT